jgi:hypothetical protein
MTYYPAVILIFLLIWIVSKFKQDIFEQIFKVLFIAVIFYGWYHFAIVSGNLAVFLSDYGLESLLTSQGTRPYEWYVGLVDGLFILFSVVTLMGLVYELAIRK